MGYPKDHSYCFVLIDLTVTACIFFFILQFDLVCENAYKSDLASTMYFCGVMLGGPFFGYMADKYGRKPVLGFTLFASSIIGVAIFIFRNYISFVILRFCLGFFIQVGFIVS